MGSSLHPGWSEKGGGRVLLFAEKADLRLPGPTAIPPQVERAIQQTLNHPMMDYRNEEFTELVRETSAAARMVFGTRNDVILLAGSGTSALETAMVNLVGPSEKAIICVAGYFGEYFVGIAERLGVEVVRVDVPWGETVDPGDVKAALDRHPDARAVFVTHCETSTGALNPIEAIAAEVRGRDAVLVVDAVSSLGGAPMRMDAWGVDVVASCSQKALMLPPGLALVAVGEKAWQAIRRRRSPSFYFDLRQYASLPEQGQTPYTPNIALVAGLREALRLMAEEGMENVYRRHALLRDMTRAGVRALNLRCLVRDEFASPTVTSVAIEAMDADALRTVLRRQLHVAVGGGLGRLKGRLLRLGHMGYCDEGDVLKMLAALESAMAASGLPVELGAGVAAAQRLWLERVQADRPTVGTERGVAPPVHA